MAPEKSQIDELLADPQNAEPGQEDMPTPEQVIAAENARATGEPAPAEEAQTTTRPAPERKEEGNLDEEVAAAIEKLNAGQTLTDDEKAAIVEMKALAGDSADADEDKTYTIAGKVFTRAEVVARMKDEWLKGEDGEEINPSPERLNRMVEGFVKSRNRERQHVEVQKQSEVNSAERQALLQAKTIRQQEVDRKRALHQRLQRDLEEERARAAVNIDPATIQGEDGRVDFVKQAQYNRALDASERASRLEKEATEVEGQIAEESRTLFIAELSALMAVAPQYKIEGDVRSAVETIAKGGTLDRTAKLKLLDLEQIIMDARKKGITAEEEYELLKERGTLAFKPAAQSVGSGKPRNVPGLKTTAENLTQMLADYKKRRAAAPPSAAGGGVSRQGDHRSDARKLVDHDRAVLEGGEKDDFLESWKTGTHIVKGR